MIRFVAFAIAVIATTSSLAQDYPSRPIQLVVPFSAGGAVDSVGRLMAQKLTDRLGKPVVVDNRPGAHGLIANEIAARSKPAVTRCFTERSVRSRSIPAR